MKMAQLSRSIQVSISHVVLGVSIGSLIESLLPREPDNASVKQKVFEAVVQVGLNGAALSLVSSFLQNDDPTFGIPFSMALFEAQPELGARIRSLGAVIKDQVSQLVQQTDPLVSAA